MNLVKKSHLLLLSFLLGGLALMVLTTLGIMEIVSFWREREKAWLTHMSAGGDAWVDGRHEEAIVEYEKALQRAEQLPLNDTEVLATLDVLCNELWRNGEYSKVEPLLVKAIGLRSDALAAKRLDQRGQKFLAHDLSELSKIRLWNGQREEALRHAKRAVDLLDRIHPPDDGAMVSALYCYEGVLQSWPRSDKREELGETRARINRLKARMKGPPVIPRRPTGWK